MVTPSENGPEKPFESSGLNCGLTHGGLTINHDWDIRTYQLSHGARTRLDHREEVSDWACQKQKLGVGTLLDVEVKR